MTLSIIVAVSRNGVIGSKDSIPWYLPSDLKRFVELTKGHTVVMGRKTFESIVKKIGHPLKGRRNIVLSRSGVKYDGCEVASSWEDVLKLVSKDEEVFVIGGGEVYSLALPYVDKLYITEVDTEFVGDVFFPKIDLKDWNLISREEFQKDEKNLYPYRFIDYEKK